MKKVWGKVRETKINKPKSHPNPQEYMFLNIKKKSWGNVKKDLPLEIIAKRSQRMCWSIVAPNRNTLDAAATREPAARCSGGAVGGSVTGVIPGVLSRAGPSLPPASVGPQLRWLGTGVRY